MPQNIVISVGRAYRDGFTWASMESPRQCWWTALTGSLRSVMDESFSRSGRKRKQGQGTRRASSHEVTITDLMVMVQH